MPQNQRSRPGTTQRSTPFASLTGIPPAGEQLRAQPTRGLWKLPPLASLWKSRGRANGCATTALPQALGRPQKDAVSHRGLENASRFPQAPTAPTATRPSFRRSQEEDSQLYSQPGHAEGTQGRNGFENQRSNASEN